jgi:acetyltransferase-like isoleucine patch superfamily enzyme
MSLVVRSQVEHNVSVYERVSVSDSRIGAYSYIASRTSISGTSIGRFCSIGPDCKFGVGLHPARGFVSTSPIFFSMAKQVGITFATKNYFEESKQIVVGNDVWVGTNAIIFDGVRIGNGAIIAAGAVVTSDVPDYAIYGGVPAKLIRYRFPPEQISWLMDFRWWDKDEDWLRSHYEDFHSIDRLMSVAGADS